MESGAGYQERGHWEGGDQNRGSESARLEMPLEMRQQPDGWVSRREVNLKLRVCISQFQLVQRNNIQSEETERPGAEP